MKRNFSSLFLALCLCACAGGGQEVNGQNGGPVDMSDLLGNTASGGDLSGAFKNYQSMREAQLLDDRCDILAPDERMHLNSSMRDLASFLASRQASAEIPDLENRAQNDAAGQSCNTAGRSVHLIYWAAMARLVELPRLLFVWAMDGGDRCKVISPEEHNILMQAWLDSGARIRNEYGVPVFAISSALENQMAPKSETMPCAGIRKLIVAALKIAAMHSVPVPHTSA